MTHLGRQCRRMGVESPVSRRDTLPGCSIDFAFFFFFNDTATTEIYTLSLHDALPISCARSGSRGRPRDARRGRQAARRGRSEEHTSELQSRLHLVCRLLLEKKNHAIRRYRVFAGFVKQSPQPSIQVLCVPLLLPLIVL